MFDVQFYENSDGVSQISRFILSLGKKEQAKVLRTICLLRDNGSALREPHSKLLNDGIFELRVKLGSNTFRILYFFDDQHTIILTNGFMKKTQKIPPSEIEKAKKYRAEYFMKGG